MLKPKLIQGRYKDKDYVILQLGTHGDKLVGLISNNMSADEIIAAKDKFKSPGLMGLKEAAAWIKENLPFSYRNAYRHFKFSEFKVLKEYKL